MAQLFITLPAQYDAVVTAMENLDDENLKLTMVKFKISKTETGNLWHKRLGHIGNKGLMKSSNIIWQLELKM